MRTEHCHTSEGCVVGIAVAEERMSVGARACSRKEEVVGEVEVGRWEGRR